MVLRDLGVELLVRYAVPGPPEWHARIVIGRIGVLLGHSWHVVLTPDGDIYAEDFGNESAEIQGIRERPLDLGVPYGVDPATVYDFRVRPVANELRLLVEEGQRLAALERGARELPDPNAAVPAAAPVPLPGPAAPLIAAPAAAVPPALGVDPGGLGALLRRLPVGGALGGVPPAAAPAAPAAPLAPGGGLAALAAAVAGGAGAGLAPAPVAAPAAMLVAPAAPGAQATGDARTLSVTYDTNGERFREWAAAVQHLEAMTWPDSPVRGPVTVVWVARFIRDNAGTPTSWHQKWLTMVRMQPSDPGVMAHDSFSRLLEIMLCFDQLNIGALASAEYAARQLQMIEEKYREKVLGVASDDTGEAQLFTGTNARSGLCIAPEITAWVAEELRKESAVMKERRKAREERALARPKGK